MKMYIFIKDSVPDGMAPVVAAHAALACYLKFEHDEDMVDWLNYSFKKVVCRVSDKEFDVLKNIKKHNITTESSLESKEVAMTFCPRDEPQCDLNWFNSYKLWKPKTTN